MKVRGNGDEAAEGANAVLQITPGLLIRQSLDGADDSNSLWCEGFVIEIMLVMVQFPTFLLHHH